MNSKTIRWQYTTTKVGTSDCERTFAGASGNDEDAPKHKVAALQPATRGKRREAGSGHSSKSQA